MHLFSSLIAKKSQSHAIMQFVVIRKQQRAYWQHRPTARVLNARTSAGFKTNTRNAIANHPRQNHGLTFEIRVVEILSYRVERSSEACPKVLELAMEGCVDILSWGKQTSDVGLPPDCSVIADILRPISETQSDHLRARTCYSQHVE